MSFIRAVARISRAVREMNEYINTLLPLAQEETPHQPETGTRISEMLPHLIDQYDPLAREQGYRVHLKVVQDTVVPAPASLIAIVVSNLLRNARQYSSQGRVDITVAA